MGKLCKSKILALVMCIAMIFSVLPVGVLAEDESGDGGAESEAYVAWIGETGYTTLDAAINAAEDGATIKLSEGRFTTYGKNSPKKSLTFEGAGTEKTFWGIGATIPDPSKFGTEYNGDYSFDGCDTITFKNMTLQSGNVDYLGFIRANNTIVENCIVEGKTFYWGYTSATFTNTTFNCPSGDYALWTYSSPTMTFDNCTFNSSGKVINVYTDNGAGKYNITVNYNNCKVINSGISLKPVLNINDSNMGDYKYILNITGDNEVTDVKADDITCSALFGFGGKEKIANNSGRSVVTINDTKVWENGERACAHNDVVFSTGSYNGNTEKQYTDGYIDDAFDVDVKSTPLFDGRTVTVTTKTCKYCGYQETTTSTEGEINPAKEWTVSKSKIAVNPVLDENYEDKIKLSLPSEQVELSSDIVFVLDTSDCVGEVMGQVKELVEDLKEAQESSGADIKVGVVAFKGSALPMFDGELVSVEKAYDELTKLIKEVAAKETTSEKEEVVKGYLNADDSFISNGSNLHSGLLEAQKLLAKGNAQNDRKYVITVTDGMTYYWNDDAGNVYGVYGGSSSNGAAYPSLLFYAWCEAHNVPQGTYTLPSDFEGWDSYIENAAKMMATDIDQYKVDVRKTKDILDANFSSVRFSTIDALNENNIPFVPENEKALHAQGIDYSVMACLETYKNMVDNGYKCYVINAKYDETTFPGLFTDKLNEMAGVNGKVDFNSVGKDILYLVDKGSYVYDEMGIGFDNHGNTYDIDFMTDKVPTITVGDETLITKYEDTGKTITYRFYHNAEDTEEAFSLVYESATDSFKWNINEPISNYKRVTLTYNIKLRNPQTTAGTYFVDTNAKTELYPKSTFDTEVSKTPISYDSPTVSYTVEDDTPIIPIINFVDVTIRKVDADDNSIVLSGAVFDLYRKGFDKPYLTGLTTDKNGEILLRDLNENTTYYLVETSAPEGYKLSDTKKEFTTGNTDSTVYFENHKSEIPSVLESGDHFAYIVGYPDGNVRPTGNITRAEVATIFFRLLTEEARTANMTQENPFSDVNKGDWYNCAISTLHAMGIVNGYTDGTFNPNGFITRAEFAAIAARFDSMGNEFKHSFDDVYGHWAEDEIAAAQAHGWLKGYEDGTFRPDQLITRAEAMTIVNRVLVRLPESADALHADMVIWPDNLDTTAWYYLAVQEATNSHYYERNTETTEYWTEIRAPRDWTLLEK